MGSVTDKCRVALDVRTVALVVTGAAAARLSPNGARSAPDVGRQPHRPGLSATVTT